MHLATCPNRNLPTDSADEAVVVTLVLSVGTLWMAAGTYRLSRIAEAELRERTTPTMKLEWSKVRHIINHNGNPKDQSVDAIGKIMTPEPLAKGVFGRVFA